MLIVAAIPTSFTSSNLLSLRYRVDRIVFPCHRLPVFMYRVDPTATLAPSAVSLFLTTVIWMRFSEPLFFGLTVNSGTGVFMAYSFESVYILRKEGLTCFSGCHYGDYLPGVETTRVGLIGGLSGPPDIELFKSIFEAL